MRMLFTAVAIALVGAWTPMTHAQQLPPGVTAAECDKLAGIPNAPISVETCKAMFGMATGLEAAANDPRARRPGDEAMNCAQIFDELKTLADAGLSMSTTGRMDAVVKEGQAAAARGAAEGTAFMAETAAIGIAMAAMGPFVPNFVGAAIVAAWQGRAMALGARLQAEQAKLSAQISPALGAAAAELAQSMQSNPRFARLGQLAIQRACEPPAIQLK